MTRLKKKEMREKKKMREKKERNKLTQVMIVNNRQWIKNQLQVRRMSLSQNQRLKDRQLLRHLMLKQIPLHQIPKHHQIPLHLIPLHLIPKDHQIQTFAIHQEMPSKRKENDLRNEIITGESVNEGKEIRIKRWREG